MSSVSALNSLLSSSATATSSSSVNLSSLLSAATGATSTGIDVGAAVTAAIYAAQAPERQWQAQQATVKSQISALTAIQTALSTLSTDLDQLNNTSGPLTARTVASSSSAVSATATGATVLGSHTVAVNSLAAAASWYSPAVPSAATPLGVMQLQLVGTDGTTHTFTTGSGVNSLADLATAITSDSSSGVTASIVTDTTGARLALVSKSTGASNDFGMTFGAVSVAHWSSTPVASTAAALTAGSFSVSDGSQSSTISVRAGETLADIAGQINAAGLNVSASVTTDGAGAHLSLEATSGSLAVTGDPGFSFTRASQGSNASLVVDGVPISSATNHVTGAINGLTLNLAATTTGGPVNLSVAADSSQIAGAVSSFVADYNAALGLVNSQFTYSSTSGSQGVLSGDTTVRSLQSALMSAVGFPGSGAFSSLASLGVTMSNDGSLAVDSAKLSDAVANNSTALQNFFQGAALNGFAQSFQTALKAFTSPASGALTIGVRTLNSTYSSLQSQVDDYESGYIASQRTVLTAMYSKAEIALQSLPATLKQLQAQLGNNSGS